MVAPVNADSSVIAKTLSYSYFNLENKFIMFPSYASSQDCFLMNSSKGNVGKIRLGTLSAPAERG